MGHGSSGQDPGIVSGAKPARRDRLNDGDPIGLDHTALIEIPSPAPSGKNPGKTW
jgi:hypothetical protein